MFGPETGDLIAGPAWVEPHARAQWPADGIEASGAGAFTTYDDLLASRWANARQRDAHEQATDTSDTSDTSDADASGA